jgi:hypothetical protein
MIDARVPKTPPFCTSRHEPRCARTFSNEPRKREGNQGPVGILDLSRLLIFFFVGSSPILLQLAFRLRHPCLASSTQAQYRLFHAFLGSN